MNMAIKIYRDVREELKFKKRRMKIKEWKSEKEITPIYGKWLKKVFYLNVQDTQMIY